MVSVMRKFEDHSIPSHECECLGTSLYYSSTLPLITEITTDTKRVVCPQHCKEGVAAPGEDEIM